MSARMRIRSVDQRKRPAVKKSIGILFVEDSEDDTLLMVHQLKRAGMVHEYERVDSAETFRNALTQKAWDLILCDYKLPQFDGCATNLWVPFSCRCPMLPKVFPPIAHDVAAKGDNVVRSPDCPVHPRLFQTLPNDGSASCLQNTRTYKKTTLSKVRIPHPFLVLLKITDFPFTCRLIVSRQG